LFYLIRWKSSEYSMKMGWDHESITRKGDTTSDS
jgi:hypothetical protein